MAAGADGYMLKDADGTALLQAIQAVLRGEMPLHPAVSRYLVGNITNQNNKKGISALTDREKEVLELVARGWSNQAVAQSLNLSKGTIKVHMSNILGKLNVASRTEAAMLALQTGMISLE